MELLTPADQRLTEGGLRLLARLRARPGGRAGPVVAQATSVVLIAFLLTGCDERERTNPLDPGNPATGGVPDWLRAAADDEAVDLGWQPPPADGLARVELLRSTNGSVPIPVFATVDPDVTSYRDSLVVNGDSLAYRLDLVRTDGSRLSLPAKPATPGPSVPWILTNTPFGLIRATPDARGVRLRGGGPSTLFDAQAVPDGSSLWAVDFYGDEAIEFDRDGAVLTRIPVELPYRMALDPVRNRVWTGTWALGLSPVVRVHTVEGDLVERFDLAGEIRDLVVDPASGACYVARGSAGGVSRLAVGEDPVQGIGVETVMLVSRTGEGAILAVNPLSRRLLTLDPTDLELRDQVDLQDVPLAVAPASSGVWVAEGSVALVHRGESLAVITALVGEPGVVDLAFDEGTGSLWVAAPTADRVTLLDLARGSRTRLPLFEPFRVTVGNVEARTSSP